jgi:5-formyltetrahydrofolate cyclo-ligase
MDLRAEKRRLRRSTVARILALDPAVRRAQQAALVERFDDLPGLRAARNLLLYVTAFPEEVNTRPLLERALAAGQTLVCPRVDRAARRLVLHVVSDLSADLAAGALGIPEPRAGTPMVDVGAIDWVLVPGLLFDERCYRLGRGAGHYDRLLPGLRPNVPRWALGFDCQWVESLPLEPHDVPLDGVAFPARVVVRRSPATPR